VLSVIAKPKPNSGISPPRPLRNSPKRKGIPTSLVDTPFSLVPKNWSALIAAL